MKQSVIIQKIDGLVRAPIESLGYSLVRIKLSSQQGEEVLQIMAEPQDADRDMSVEDCAQISRHLSAILDVDEPISGAYRLEISSPGIDRPLASEAEFAAYIGQVAHVETEWPIDGRKRFKGEIVSVEDGKLTLRLDAKHNVTLEIEGIQNAKLALTEELVRQYLSKRKQSESEN